MNLDELAATWGEGQGPWRCVASSPTLNAVVAANSQGEIVAWQQDTHAELARWTPAGSVAWERVVFAPDGRTFVAVAWDRLSEAWIFNLDVPEDSWTVPAIQSKCAAFSPHGNSLKSIETTRARHGIQRGVSGG